MVLHLNAQAVPRSERVAVARIVHQSAHSDGGTYNFTVALHACTCRNECGQKDVGEVGKMGCAVVTAEVRSGQGAEAVQQRWCTPPMEPLLVLSPASSEKASQHHCLVQDAYHLHPHHFC
jgi:hypothetical protein